MRVRLDIAYVGTRYVGWQRQLNGVSIQETLEKLLSRIYAKPVSVVGAGRTDAGVHASAQAAHFDAPRDRPAVKDLPRILSKLLPADIAILRAAAVPPAFHARKSAVRRTYLYRILISSRPDPFRAPYVWHAPWAAKLSIGKMKRAARRWLGTKDFAAFAIRVRKKQRTRRRMERIQIRRAGDEIHLKFTADSFLHRMIRRMVAVLIDIGAGKTVTRPAFSAPAGGLCLLKITY